MAKIPDESLPAVANLLPDRAACPAFPRNSAGHRTPAHITQNGEACPVSAQSERHLAREAGPNRQPIYRDNPYPSPCSAVTSLPCQEMVMLC